MTDNRFITYIFTIVIIGLTASPSLCRSRCLSGNCLNGTGKATLAGVKTFEGLFVNGKPNGTGTMTYSNGNIISGFFAGWEPAGKTILKCSNGSEHQIDFSNKNIGLSKKIKTACTVLDPIEIDYEEEAEIKRRLDRISISNRNMEIADQFNNQRRAQQARKVSNRRRNTGSNTSHKTSTDWAKMEKLKLNQDQTRAENKCKASKNKDYRNNCWRRVQAKYNDKKEILRKNPDYYFHNKNIENSSRNSSTSSGSAQQSGQDFGQCAGACGSEQGICIGQCQGNGQCISKCTSSHGRCIARCH